MQLRDSFETSAVSLALRGASKDENLSELVALLGMYEMSQGTL